MLANQDIFFPVFGDNVGVILITPSHAMRPSARSLTNIEGRVVRLGVNVSVKLFHLVAMPERKCSVLFMCLLFNGECVIKNTGNR